MMAAKRESDASSMISIAYSERAISVTSVNSSRPTSSRSKKTSAHSPITTARSSFSSYHTDAGSPTSTNSPPTEPSKKYRFDTAPKLVKTPWEADRSKRAFPRQWSAESSSGRPSTSRGPATVLPARVFKMLPVEVYDRILDQMEVISFSDKTGACLSCHLADLYSLCLVSRMWESRARAKLYTKLWILINDFSSRFDRSGTPFLRIKLLRRTLRERSTLAATVREIHVPGAQAMYKKSNSIDRAAIISVLASLVMECPNLERLTGLHVPFDHNFDRLTHALATRENLREKVWLLKGIEEGYDSIGAFRTNARPVRYDGSIANGDVFLESHSRWTKLETLVLFGQDTGNLDYRGFVGTFRSLSGSLKQLLICGFNATQFNDRTMAALPRELQSLRLQDLPGVTERGLNRLRESSNETMRSLSLVNMDIKSARLIASYFASMPNLRRFALVQSTSPLWPTDNKDSSSTNGINGSSGPKIYASQSLEFLHWDISPFFHPSLSHLASSVQAGAFPKLTTIRAPCDDGTLQALCRPRSTIARPADIDAAKAAASLGLRSSSLAAARVEAQKRLEATKEAPLMHILVTDENGKRITRYNVKRFMGSVTSKIDYILEGDGEWPEYRLSDLGNNVYCKAASVASGAIGFVPPALRGQTSFGEGGGVSAAGGALLEADSLLAAGSNQPPPSLPSKNSGDSGDGSGGIRTRMITRPGTSGGVNGAGGAVVGSGPRTCSGAQEQQILSFGAAVAAAVSSPGAKVPGGHPGGGGQKSERHVPREKVRLLRTDMFF